MSVSVAFAAAVQKNGKISDKAQISKLQQLISEILSLSQYKMDMLLYLESTIKSVAPNICEIIGPKIAAKLVSSAGGITELSRIPACNI